MKLFKPCNLSRVGFIFIAIFVCLTAFLITPQYSYAGLVSGDAAREVGQATYDGVVVRGETQIIVAEVQVNGSGGAADQIISMTIENVGGIDSTQILKVQLWRDVTQEPTDGLDAGDLNIETATVWSSTNTITFTNFDANDDFGNNYDVNYLISVDLYDTANIYGDTLDFMWRGGGAGSQASPYSIVDEDNNEDIASGILNNTGDWELKGETIAITSPASGGETGTSFNVRGVSAGVLSDTVIVTANGTDFSGTHTAKGSWVVYNVTVTENGLQDSFVAQLITEGVPRDKDTNTVLYDQTYPRISNIRDTSAVDNTSTPDANDTNVFMYVHDTGAGFDGSGTATLYYSGVITGTVTGSIRDDGSGTFAIEAVLPLSSVGESGAVHYWWSITDDVNNDTPTSALTPNYVPGDSGTIRVELSDTLILTYPATPHDTNAKTFDNTGFSSGAASDTVEVTVDDADTISTTHSSDGVWSLTNIPLKEVGGQTVKFKLYKNGGVVVKVTTITVTLDLTAPRISEIKDSSPKDGMTVRNEDTYIAMVVRDTGVGFDGSGTVTLYYDGALNGSVGMTTNDTGSGHWVVEGALNLSSIHGSGEISFWIGASDDVGNDTLSSALSPSYFPSDSGTFEVIGGDTVTSLTPAGNHDTNASASITIAGVSSGRITDTVMITVGGADTVFGTHTNRGIWSVSGVALTEVAGGESVIITTYGLGGKQLTRDTLTIKYDVTQPRLVGIADTAEVTVLDGGLYKNTNESVIVYINDTGAGFDVGTGTNSCTFHYTSNGNIVDTAVTHITSDNSGTYTVQTTIPFSIETKNANWGYWFDCSDKAGNNNMTTDTVYIESTPGTSTVDFITVNFGSPIADTISIYAIVEGIENGVNEGGVILYNPTPIEMDLGGYKLTGADNDDGMIDFSAGETIAPFGYLFVVESASGLADKSGDIAAPDVWTGGNSFTNDTVALSNSDTIVDLVGMGTSAVFEGQGRAPNVINSAIVRRGAQNVIGYGLRPGGGGGGFLDSDNNDSDFFNDTTFTRNEPWPNRRTNVRDRMAFDCTAESSTIILTQTFHVSCTAVVEWNGILQTDSPIVYYDTSHYPGGSVWMAFDPDKGNLGGLSADSEFTRGTLNNYALTISNTPSPPETVTITLRDGYSTGVIQVWAIIPDSPAINIRFPVEGDTVCCIVPVSMIIWDTDGSSETIAWMKYAVDNSTTWNNMTLEAGFDTNALTGVSSAGSTFTINWNSKADLPDTVVKIRIWVGVHDGNPDFREDTRALFDTGAFAFLDNVSPDKADTVNVKAYWYDSVTISWSADTDLYYYHIYRDTDGKDTITFVDVVALVTGQDSVTGYSFSDTSIGPAGADSEWYWIIVAGDSWGNQGTEIDYYSDSQPGEILQLSKRVVSVQINGLDSPVMPGATVHYEISISNTEGYSPVDSMVLLDYIPRFTDYSETTISLDTGIGFLDQTDNRDTDISHFGTNGDSNYIQLEFNKEFRSGDTALIRFKVIIR